MTKLLIAVRSLLPDFVPMAFAGLLVALPAHFVGVPPLASAIAGFLAAVGVYRFRNRRSRAGAGG